MRKPIRVLLRFQNNHRLIPDLNFIMERRTAHPYHSRRSRLSILTQLDLPTEQIRLHRIKYPTMGACLRRILNSTPLGHPQPIIQCPKRGRIMRRPLKCRTDRLRLRPLPIHIRLKDSVQCRHILRMLLAVQ